MVGDDNVCSGILGHSDSIMASGPAVNGDDKTDPVWQRVIRDVAGLQAVSFFYPMGNIKRYVGTGILQKFQKDDCGSNAVNIIITEDQYLFMIYDGNPYLLWKTGGVSCSVNC